MAINDDWRNSTQEQIIADIDRIVKETFYLSFGRPPDGWTSTTNEMWGDGLSSVPNGKVNIELVKQPDGSYGLPPVIERKTK